MKKENTRNSNIELFRIITMLVIIAHHYVVNSGIADILFSNSSMGVKNIFYLIFGCGGKTGINCFVLITGYFMCKSKITLRKFLKLFCEAEFYSFVIFMIFWITGYEPFSIKMFIKNMIPFLDISTGFMACFLLFYLLIPFLNILIKHMKKREHEMLLALCLFIYTFLPSLAKAYVVFNYITWFVVLYILISYIRYYPKEIYQNTKVWGILTIVTIVLSWISIVVCRYVGIDPYFFVAESNKILALVTALCAFMFFKNVNIGYNRLINKIAASVFGVFMIHTNSDTMRRWLWYSTFKNGNMYFTKYYVLHAVISVILIYIICTIIDVIRIKMLEKPFLHFIDKKLDI